MVRLFKLLEIPVTDTGTGTAILGKEMGRRLGRPKKESKGGGDRLPSLVCSATAPWINSLRFPNQGGVHKPHSKTPVLQAKI